MEASFCLKRPQFVNKPFSRLPLKQRAVFVLHLAGFTDREIVGIVNGASKGSVYRWLSICYREYCHSNGANLPISEGK